MSRGPLLDKIDARVILDRQEGDIAYFHALTLQLEYVTKIVTSGILACVRDDADRHRYTFEHRIVRANAIGDWADVLNAVLTGPAAHFFDPGAQGMVRELTERVGADDWRFSAVSALDQAAKALGVASQVGAKVALRQFFQIAAAVRNRTRGHGAITSDECSRLCPQVANAVEAVALRLQLFSVPWVYLHRNLSGKYRVCPLLGEPTPFEHLRKTKDASLPNGVWVSLDQSHFVHLPLVFSDPNLDDVLLPNGNYQAGSFEVLSYITNESQRKDGGAWANPPGQLPTSETEGHHALEQRGNTFSNLPPRLIGYVPRPILEGRLREELLTTDRHPIVSLTGPGGIGKTSIAIASIEEMTQLQSLPYEVVVWISARDVDLLESGPKPVSPKVTAQKDIALVATHLLEPSERSDPTFRPESYFQKCLASGAAGPTLFVLDNFETLVNPSDVFRWIDTYVRLPNKVLITTRSRSFDGDYPIEIGGMTEEEALALVERHSARLGISALVTTTYAADLIGETDGHPYVIKMLLGEVAKQRRAVKPERVVAGSDQLLRALFERTFEALTPGSQRVFLLLCSWRVFVPRVALEAVLLRPENERFDVRGALTELRRFSLVEEVEGQEEQEGFVGVPLAAAMYGRRKLDVSQFKVAVEEDRKILMEFGAGRREDAHRGVLPRIDNLVRAVAERAGTNPQALANSLPTLEYLASQVPRAYLLLADLVLELGETGQGEAQAKKYLRSFLETADPGVRQGVWLQLADLCHRTDDAVGEVHALSEAALMARVTPAELGVLANRINNRIRELKGRRIDEAWSAEVRALLERVIAVMERRIGELTATDCSRLAWLCLNVGNADRARDIANAGIRREPNNEYCQNLIDRLSR